MADRLSNVVRRKFVEYFTTRHGHKFIASSPVLPKHDKSLSFANAGMNQFKPLFLADLDQYSPSRVCNYQKCIRVGGKMCDLDKIGTNFRHHTFFEMLGNWSFNDYHKAQACEWALDFLVNQLELDSNKLVVTYYKDSREEDAETREIWSRLGISSDRIIANDTGDNFWEMGTEGPCGMSTEIFYPIGDQLIEIWNLVFIDRQRLGDSGQIVPLKSKFVDTGMGLERILSAIEGVESNYDTDLFRSMFDVIKRKSNVEPYGGSLTNQMDIKYRTLADHCRMITVALADGVEPGRRGASFLLRSIIKKSLLIARDDFHQEVPRYLIFDLVDETIDILSKAYPELPKKVKMIRKVLAHESKRYLNYLEKHDDKESDPKKEESKVIELRNIKSALRVEPNETTSYLVSGRVSNFRPYRSFNFIDLIDGSSRDHLQTVISRDLLSKPELGSYLTCEGHIVPSRGQKQSTEFKVDAIKFLGGCDPLEYPLANAAADNNNWYRQFTHLRPRAEHFSSLLRIKSELELSLHMIMKQMDFFRVHTPSLTSNDSEASSDLFTVKRTKMREKCQQSNSRVEESDNESGESDEGAEGERIMREGYFNKDVFLITSAQLHLENLAAALSRVYTLSTTFRAESSISTRHLCEFLMFELEESNVNDQEALMNRAESIIKFVAQYLYEISEHKMDFHYLLEKNSNTDTYSKLSQEPYIRMSYREALETLRNKTDFSEGDTNYGADIGRLHERKLLDYCNDVPIFITNYPKQLKPFYMKCDLSDQEALCFDLIAPHGGELCGGSLREDSLDKLLSNLGKNHLGDFEWYLDTRRFGSFPHGGFGIGIERLLQALLGIKNIKDTTAFPRWVRHCPM